MHLNRRSFVQATGVALGGVLLGGCQTDSPPPNEALGLQGQDRRQTETQSDPRRSPVALVRTSDRASGVREALRLLGDVPVRAKSVLIKPNFNTADPTPGSTHIDVLRELILAVQAQGARSISIGDRSGGPGVSSTRDVMEKKGVFSLAQDLKVRVINFDEANRWVEFQRPDLHWKNGFVIAEAVAQAESIVQTCCLKTHQYGGIFTLSLKNSVGIVARQGFDLMSELHSSQHQRKMIAEINLAYRPDLVVLDGVEAFVTGGPHSGERVQANLILAGQDRVAIDAVGVAMLKHLGSTPEIMNRPVWKQEQISRAVELGLGAAGPDQIELLTPDPESATLGRELMAILQQA